MDAHSLAHRYIASSRISWNGHPGGPIKWVMLWFSEALVSLPQFMGVHYGRDVGRHVLLVMYPDGSQKTEIFDDEAALVEGALKLRDELIRRGWWLCLEPPRCWVNES